ncbi:glutamate--tRNA ligase [Brucepastera parasyntrophica]|uniref:glutamate--tRNA ligase n=1 Tax=Brucepastera parasyntrophica TaxID=2880008 RepID=UPI00210C59F3|nr:glutamate--tRNA ligase [Brucepastera parasyntrophica]ULQ59451.1 glutamate--tRNA ligase [Brucepastera parasyntrophica]
MEVRVRYAPSPTGLQHIGGVRTALFNYLFARSTGGKFILRLEDTDRTRYAEEYVRNLYDTCSWLGIDWDEGGSKGGEYGPYVQSERFELYKKHALELVEKGCAYYCFCDSERLERIRKIQTMNKMPPGYDRHCRSLTTEDVKANMDAGLPYVIRLKIPLEGTTAFHDTLLGDIEWKNEDINPDPVLLKSDGFPTYHLANVVDDHYMKISHVMRAQEWIPSTPLHVLMYQAFGWDHPEYCHLPMVMGQDGQKLSKRHGATSCNEFRNGGYLKDALINYIAMLGCSYEDGRDMYTMEELEKLFKMDHINKAPAVFDYKKLEWFNGQYMRLKTDEELFSLTWPFIANAGIFCPMNEEARVSAGLLFADQALFEPTAEQREILMKVMPLIRERLHFLTDAPAMVAFLFKEPEIPGAEEIIPKRLDAEKTKEVLLASIDVIEKLEGLSEEQANGLFHAKADELGVKLGDFMMPVRMAVTGSRISPPLVGSIQILGIREAVSRIKKTVEARF